MMKAIYRFAITTYYSKNHHYINNRIINTEH